MFLFLLPLIPLFLSFYSWGSCIWSLWISRHFFPSSCIFLFFYISLWYTFSWISRLLRTRFVRHPASGAVSSICLNLGINCCWGTRPTQIRARMEAVCLLRGNLLKYTFLNTSERRLNPVRKAKLVVSMIVYSWKYFCLIYTFVGVGEFWRERMKERWEKGGAKTEEGSSKLDGGSGTKLHILHLFSSAVFRNFASYDITRMRFAHHHYYTNISVLGKITKLNCNISEFAHKLPMHNGFLLPYRSLLRSPSK